MLTGNEWPTGTLATDGHGEEPSEPGYLEKEPEAGNDPAEEVVARFAFQELYGIVRDELRGEDERAIGLLSLLCGLTPRAIFHARHDLFPTVGDVYRVKRHVIERLRRNKRLRAYLRARTAGEEWRAQQDEGMDPHPAVVRPQPALAPACDLERQRREVAQRDLLYFLEQRALLESRKDLLRIVELQTQHMVDQADTCERDGVRYYRRLSFCGKQRCRARPAAVLTAQRCLFLVRRRFSPACVLLCSSAV